jgi:hypothetical protein
VTGRPRQYLLANNFRVPKPPLLVSAIRRRHQLGNIDCCRGSRIPSARDRGATFASVHLEFISAFASPV